ncbi:MAG: four helix bundle protein [bacterium]|nr:four helix bundle protein [bacterium]
MGNATASNPIRSYRDLIVWQKSVEVVIAVYKVTRKFPASEQFAITSQVQRAAVSVPANIAEGYGRNTPKEYTHFLRIAHGSLSELETLLTISQKLSYCSAQEYSTLEKHTSEVARMLYALRKSIS